MNKDLVAIFEYLEREKGIQRAIVIEAIEESLRASCSKKHLRSLKRHCDNQSQNGQYRCLLRKRNCR